MTTESNEQRKAAKKATDAANKAKWAKQVIRVGPFKIYRLDELNWSIDHRDKTYYYGSLLSALFSLPNKLINEGEVRDIRDVTRALETVEEEIRRLYAEKFTSWEEK